MSKESHDLRQAQDDARDLAEQILESRGQPCEDIKIVPNGVITTAADGTHFVECVMAVVLHP